jgi:hypothetical protein
MVDHKYCKCQRPVTVYGVGDEDLDESQQFDIDVCMTDPDLYANQFCAYRKIDPPLNVEETNKSQTGLEKVIRSQCLKKFFGEQTAHFPKIKK